MEQKIINTKRDITLKVKDEFCHHKVSTSIEKIEVDNTHLLGYTYPFKPVIN